ALAAEAPHPLGRVGREADPRLLAVVADIDARLELLPDHMTHGGFGLAREDGGWDRLATVLAHEQVAKRRRPRKTAGMCGEDAFVAALRMASGAGAGASRAGRDRIRMPGQPTLFASSRLAWPIERSLPEVSSRSAFADTMAPPKSTAKRASTAAASAPASRPPSGMRFQQSE